MVENRKFLSDIFFRVLADAQFIACQNGRTIVVDSFAGDRTYAALQI
jgi:hypothetical protein